MTVTKPMPWHPYHDKSDNELKRILLDARHSAYELRGVNDEAAEEHDKRGNDVLKILGYRAAIEYRETYGD